MIRALIAALPLLLLALTASAQMHPSPGPGHVLVAASGGGGPAGPFTFIASTSGADDTLDADVLAGSSLNVAQHDLLVAFVTYEDLGSTTVGVQEQGGGSNVFTFDAGDDVETGSNEVSVFVGYVLDATASASATFEATLGASAQYKRLIVYQFRPTGTGTVKDITGTREAIGSSQFPSTATFSTTGDDGVVCAGSAMYTSGTYSSQEIDGVAADEVAQQNSAGMWCSVTTAALSSAVADAFYDFTSVWAATVIAFK